MGDVQYHPEKNLTSCLDRYGNEIKRILSVINSHLKKSGRPYLCGEHVSYADLMFVPWGWLTPAIMGEEFADEWKKSYPEAVRIHLSSHICVEMFTDVLGVSSGLGSRSWRRDPRCRRRGRRGRRQMRSRESQGWCRAALKIVARVSTMPQRS